MKPYVLIAEDDDGVVELLKYNLVNEDYEAGIATDGEEALMMIEERAPDLLLLDWMLPKVPGIEVCRRLRARTDTAN
ncbi:MAG: response regulator, partial [Pseudomonadota bacterium]